MTHFLADTSRPLTTLTTSLTTLAAAVLAWPAAAQTTVATESSTLDAVVVTGTRARDRSVLSSPAPIDVLSGEEVRRAAGPDGNLGAALQTLLPSFNFPRQSNSGAADHVRAAQLRGLSPDQVLVLVNGKRRHTSAVVNLESKTGKGTNPVDFAAIPLNAVKRIEVLRDGAGAQYGSDAIAGVINIILDDGAAGGEIVLDGGAHRTRFAPTGQRITDGQTAELQAKAGWALGEARLRVGLEAGTRKATNRAGLDQIPFFEDQTPANLALQGQRNYAAGDPETDKLGLWFNANAPLAGWDGYAFGTWTRRDTVGDAFFRYPDSSANISSIYPGGYRPETTGRSDDLGLTIGARGTLVQDWLLDASLGLGRNEFEFGVQRSLNASLGPASPTRFHLGDYRSGQVVANIDASRPLAVGLAKPATLSIGADLRRESFRTQPGDPASYAVGPFIAPAGAQAGPGLTPADAADVSRSVAGLYGELSADLTRNLYAQAALRHDRYGDAGSASTGKLAARLEIAPKTALRGAVSSSFRAPTLAQQHFSFTVTDYGDGGSLSQVRTLPAAGEVARALGAEALRPERSRSLSLGLTAQPLTGLSLSLDTYRVDVDKRITLSESFSSPELTQFLASRFGLAGVDGINFFTNAADTRTRGADLVAQWRGRAVGGELSLSAALSVSHTTLHRTQALPAQLASLGVGGSLVGTEERNTITDAAPRQRHVLTANWSGPQIGATVRATRHGKTTRVLDFGDGFTPTQTYAAVWQLDLEVEWRPTRQLSVALGGVNATDKYPSRSIDDISYFGNLPYDVLSPVGFNGAYWYARVRYSF